MPALTLPRPATRALLTMVRRRIRDLERRAASPRQQAKVAALTAAGRHDKNAWRLDQLRALEDSLCQALGDENGEAAGPQRAMNP